MNLSTGNSGNKLYPAVVKLGPEAQQEGSYCQFLGDQVCPKIFAIIPNGYVMEGLESAPRTHNLLRKIEKLLGEEVWVRPALPSSMDTNWWDKLKKYGITVPEFVFTNQTCLVHGDPTASNVLIRNKEIILCDPRPPRDYIPQYRETDMGRIVQSIFGWEEVAYRAERISWDKPDFWHNEEQRRRAFFWCGAAAARIQYLEENRPNSRETIINWCKYVRGQCHV